MQLKKKKKKIITILLYSLLRDSVGFEVEVNETDLFNINACSSKNTLNRNLIMYYHNLKQYFKRFLYKNNSQLFKTLREKKILIIFLRKFVLPLVPGEIFLKEIDYFNFNLFSLYEITVVFHFIFFVQGVMLSFFYFGFFHIMEIN